MKRNKVEQYLSRMLLRLNDYGFDVSKEALMEATSNNRLGTDVSYYIRRLRERAKMPCAVNSREQIIRNPLSFVQAVGRDKPGMMIGIEIECIYPSSFGPVDVVAKTAPAGVGVTLDGSLRAPDGFLSMEVRMMCSATDFSRLYRVCAWLAKIRADVNRTCGLHIHLDARDVTNGRLNATVRARANNLYKALNVLKYSVPPSRVANMYCSLAKMSVRERYRAVNLCAVEAHRTVEVRLGSGSVQADKIRLWTEVLLYFYRGGSVRGIDKVTLPSEAVDFVMRSDMPVIHKVWLIGRIQKFHPDSLASAPVGSLQYEGSEVLTVSRV